MSNVEHALGAAVRHAGEAIKPRLRGWSHLAAAPLAAAAGLVLVALAPADARFPCVVYAVTSTLLFTVSAIYHRGRWSPRTWLVLKRLDHANIFLIIAGTYTPFAVLLLHGSQRSWLLSLVWSGAVVGVLFRVLWTDAPRWLYVPIYLLLGWAAMMYIVDLVNANVAMMVLVLVGGIFYTVGAVIYGLKRPNPIPGVFGFHEIFHTLTVLAFLCHWTATLLIALHPAYNG